MRVNEVLAKLGEALGASTPYPKVEGLCAGSGDLEVSGIAISFSPSMDVLRRAAASGRNFILCDAHPFYLYDEKWSTLYSKTEPVLASPLVSAKRAFLEEHKLAVARLRSAWEAKMPDAGPRALATSLGWEPGAPNAGDADFSVCSVPATTLDALAHGIAGRTKLGGLRLLGAGNTRVTRIAVATGLLTPAKLERMLADPAIDAVVAGEVVEWEASPYMEDVIAAGRAAGLILVGYAASQAPVVKSVAAWAHSIFPDLPIDELSDADHIWSA